MKERCRELIETGDRLFTQRMPLVSLWQEIADNFYPERADFTVSRHLGSEFAEHLMTGSPVLARRDLANQFAAMLRPRGKEWFSLAPEDERKGESRAVTDWSKWASGAMRRAMYDPPARFTRATKEGDNDFASFGQTVITAEYDETEVSMLYRCWHLRDVAWCENERGDIDSVHRKWKISGRALAKKYKDKTPSKIIEANKKEPHKEYEARHIIIPFDEYDYRPDKKLRAGKFKYMSLMVLVAEEAILEEKPLLDQPYIIPRWQTVSGSQYAHSPCTVIALPDARLLQRITFTLMEAGEKATNPPMLAVQEAIRSDVALYAGGLTWVDAEYDERLGEVLRPLTMDKSGLNFGADMAGRHEEMIRKAFYLDQINLPAFDGAAMTATEVRVRTEEYIRAALPLFEPLEQEYNAALCEKTFNLMLQNGGFGSPRDWPEEVRGLEMKWQFDSPLADSARREDAFTFKEAAELLSMAAQIDPALVQEFDARDAFRKALRAVKAPVVDEEASEQAAGEAQGMQAMQQMMGMVGAGAQTAEQVGKAGQALGGLDELGGVAA
jgi:hypothetical protein